MHHLPLAHAVRSTSFHRIRHSHLYILAIQFSYFEIPTSIIVSVRSFEHTRIMMVRRSVLYRCVISLFLSHFFLPKRGLTKT
ncbi:uncharacterized protein F5147DRAFT_97926 [Suillus discolor]|uniref:Uncharacterized protein n=1 Tax=Suillus discolor TaxID=1912936 RepID=A0A9P7FBQ6_9AGAM|nr:uncharacterized protein F5147DRAFT_97926 [Suillus discolor]KAG2111145.1 hypothetical protein F5147DRAFT_97926 [Suillus discolor]